MRKTLAILAFVLLSVGCEQLLGPTGDNGRNPATPTPVVEQPAPAPDMPEVAVGPEPFCPFEVAEQLEASQTNGKLQVVWNIPHLNDTGQWLHRYQIEVARQNHSTVTYEVQIDSLSGPLGIRAITELVVEEVPTAVRLRAWYPNECHDDGHGNQRLNTPWSGWVDVAG